VADLNTFVICDRCGDTANSEPGLKCGRIEVDERTGRILTDPCEGTYRTEEEMQWIDRWVPEDPYDGLEFG